MHHNRIDSWLDDYVALGQQILDIMDAQDHHTDESPSITILSPDKPLIAQVSATSRSALIKIQ